MRAAEGRVSRPGACGARAVAGGGARAGRARGGGAGGGRAPRPGRGEHPCPRRGRACLREGGVTVSEERVRGHARLWRSRGVVGGARVFTRGRSVWTRECAWGLARVYGASVQEGVLAERAERVLMERGGGRERVCGAGVRTRVFTVRVGG